MNLKFKKLDPRSRIPERKTEGACGYDLYTIEPVVLLPFTITTIRTGVAVEIPEEHFGWLTGRSFWEFAGILSIQGKIDSDYRGELKGAMINFNKETITIGAHERFAQLVILKYEGLKTEGVQELSETIRGSNGFGSTGRN